MSGPTDVRLSEVNEALLLSSIRQHELTEQASLFYCRQGQTSGGVV